MRILIYDPADPILQVVSSAFLKLGHEVSALRLEGSIEDYPQQLSLEIERFKPDFLLTNNFYLFQQFKCSAELEAVCVHMALPVVCWYFEAPHASGKWTKQSRFTDSPLPSSFLFLVADSAYVDFFRSRKMTAGHLPLAVDEKIMKIRISPSLLQEMSFPLCYVGNVFKIPEQIMAWNNDFGEAFAETFHREMWQQLSGLVVDREKFEGPIQTWFEQTLPISKMFFRRPNPSVDEYFKMRAACIDQINLCLPEQLHQITKLQAGRFDYVYGFHVLTSYLKDLLDLGLRVFGEPSWEILLGQKDTRRLSEEELIACYQSSKIIFCLTKYQFKNLMHDRPLTVLAVRGFPLTDWRQDVDLMFREGEIATYRNLDEAREKIKFYLNNDSARQKIIALGSERVRKEHTYFHRAQKLLEIVSANFGLK